MKLTIDVNEEHIIALVEKEIANQILSSHNEIAHEAKRGVCSGVDKAIKAYIYAKKDDIIERVVDRATAEIVKKGIPKLLERGELK